MNSETGKWIIFLGSAIVVVGVIVYFFHDKLHWIGHLPGDIHIERENFRFYFPVTTMIVASIVLSALAYLIKKYF
jgi:hypothetical protein